jgi:hypothetical protein
MAGSMLLLAGCARFPETPAGSTAPANTLVCTMTVLGTINDSYYYFLAIDTDQLSVTGPIPVVTGSELGNGWGTLSNIGPDDPVQQPPFFVMYHDGSFSEFRNNTFIGRPYRTEITSDRKQMIVEFDQNDLGTPIPDIIQLNWITQEMITTPPQLVGVRKQYDGFGPSGNTYLDAIDLRVPQFIESGIGNAPEELPRDTTSIDAIDLVNWTVEVHRTTL